MSAPRKGSSRGKPLTKEARAKRERAIISDIKAGKLSYRQIAEKHSVSLPTVNNKARKAGISRGRRKGAKIIVTAPRSRAAAARRRARGATPRRATARTATRSTAAAASFSDAFRELVLDHFPDLSLRQFDRLSRMVENEIS